MEALTLSGRHIYAPLVGDSAVHYWLGQTCRELREAAGLTQSDISARLRLAGYGGGEKKIHVFEQGKGWHDHTEAIVAAYAEELGVDRFEIWAEALRRASFDKADLTDVSVGELPATASDEPGEALAEIHRTALETLEQVRQQRSQDQREVREAIQELREGQKELRSAIVELTSVVSRVRNRLEALPSPQERGEREAGAQD